jgi:adenine-specific DNA-methyltransferase
VRKGVKAIVLARPLEESSRAATEVLKRGQWPRFFFSKNGKGGIARKTYLDNVGGLPPTNLWEYKDVGHTDEAKKELMSIFVGKSPFDTPKPVRLLTRILLIASDKGSTVLDFFAGSGTTGHAVMKLNAEDGGRRKFILVTNNENEICEKVTYERLKRVIAREKYAAALKYFKVDYVPIGEEGYWNLADKLLGHIRELVELENGIDFRHDKSVAIVLRDEEVAGFVKGLNAGGAHILYKGHNVMLDAKARKAIEKHGVEVRTIPDYYYPELEN